MSYKWEEVLKQAGELAKDDRIHEAAELIVNNYYNEFIDKYKKEMFDDDEDDIIWFKLCDIVYDVWDYYTPDDDEETEEQNGFMFDLWWGYSGDAKEKEDKTIYEYLVGGVELVYKHFKNN